ncbi:MULTISPECIES: LysM peptidoglycan-binding domain-containing protein [Saccharopolyspora]|uniref:LysM peptidoglycan-binding domain-containing protein n=1 Tax=Saccharopolyspora gregorii TaxID=33914 RepID=A0ABP6RRZ3_9PSEU|nr:MULTISPECIES: LysM peptidoglycan-binding domain-containing protein [unclassified Saccharopolyspora]MCA1190286.1 LysM peptidoglycan-binding domain-containing protein [Saccharopolyspora sp. 6T]MCA1195154.1 LysM peptidoglycan-binding domain-containing protein [Saccharopolyspora sp. 6V]MCA1229804.1 LysM peptidoglycan-binding domain-containing protein [Saccharopolyspora sp. 6M]MCA1281488.1 LysM peptidoglycan-binding domain-containing protein [Saccharopolyspora sp. 7B]
MAVTSAKNLARAEILIMEPPAKVGAKPGATLKRVKLQFNPNKLALTKSTEWRRKPARMAAESALPEFVGSGPRSLQLEVFLDATEKHDDSVEKKVEDLMVACVPTPKSLAAKTPASPWVRFEWGTARTTSFDGVLNSFSVDYSLFDVDGKPLRATCSLGIEEASVDTPGQNPTSGSDSARRTHRVIAGDSLPQIAWNEYGDATAWRYVAEANGIDDPMVLVPGSELLVPALDESEQDGA